MEAQTTTARRFTKVDGIEMPKIRTSHYLTDSEGLENTQKDIDLSLVFGKRGEGFLGKHPCSLHSMHYGASVEIPFFYEFRTARDENGEYLSSSHHFKKNGTPLTLFLLVKNPWKNLIQKERGIYSMQGVIRSPDKKLISRANSELVRILKKNQIVS